MIRPVDARWPGQRRKPFFIGRSDELAQVSDVTLDAFARVAVLDEMAATEDGEEEDATALQGLHAKAFIAERGWDTAITIGSETPRGQRC
ncbi:hypothetical protein FLP41_07135 [Paracoccus marcusii]|uniref:hypothetical protein n=1 Tax=Paracoccus marcusii TaxID=59779 RepID=UPI002ED1D0AA|nr:hypothetical protein FLP41_07135 [Paracoccus marcusii]